MYYHGTEIERGIRILKKNKMEYSKSEHHWLGDGIYLYRECLYAFRWIVLMYKDRYPGGNIERELLTKYSILSVDIQFIEERLFSFFNPEHQIAYLKVKEECEKKRGYSKQFATYECVDGLVLNIMFKNMDYGKNYDVVEAVFPIDDLGNVKSRIKSLNEYQLCIKNPDVICNIKNFNENIDYHTFRNRLSAFDSFRQSKKSTNKYRT